MDIKRLFFGFFFVILFSVNFVSAQIDYRLQEFLNNDFIRFGLIFVLFFALIFFSTSKFFKEQRGVAVAVSFVVAFFAASFLIRQGFLYDFFLSDFFPDELAAWLTVIFIILGIILLFLAVYRWFRGCIGFTSALILLWFVLKWVEPEDYLFNGGVADAVILAHGVFTHFGVLAALAIMFLICLVRRFGLGGGGRAPPHPRPVPVSVPEQHDDNIDLILVSPREGSVFRSRAEVGFNFMFRNVPADFTDRVLLFVSYDRQGFRRENTIRSGVRGRITANLPEVNRRTEMWINLVGRDRSRISRRFGSFFVESEGGDDGRGREDRRRDDVNVNIINEVSNKISQNLHVDIKLVLEMLRDELRSKGGDEGDKKDVEKAKEEVVKKERNLYDLKQKYFSYIFAKNTQYLGGSNYQRARRFFQILEVIVNQVRKMGYNPATRFYPSAKNGGVGTNNVEPVKKYQDIYFESERQKLDKGLTRGRLSKEEHKEKMKELYKIYRI